MKFLRLKPLTWLRQRFGSPTPPVEDPNNDESISAATRDSIEGEAHEPREPYHTMGSSSEGGTQHVSSAAVSTPPKDTPEAQQPSVEYRGSVEAKLHILRQTMDPLIASRCYNQQESALYRLPDHILLSTMDQVKHDMVDFFCLRHVSHRLRSLTDDWRFRHHPFSMYSAPRRPLPSPSVPRQPPSSSRRSVRSCSRGQYEFKPGGIFQSSRSPERAIAKEIIDRISVDTICRECQRQYRRRQASHVPTSCKFAASNNLDWLYCSGCDMEHPSPSFSATERVKKTASALQGRGTCACAIMKSSVGQT